MTNDSAYLYPVEEGRWAIRRLAQGRWVDLVQDSYLDGPKDAESVLWALGITPTETALERYFPRKHCGNRCPTLELMEMCNVLDPAHPHIKNKEEHGV